MAKKLLTSALCAGVFAATMAPAEAQVRIWIPRHHHRHVRYIEVPETVHVIPIPADGYHYGGVNVYRLSGRPWEFGYPEGYVWPYGYPRTYRWPYTSRVIHRWR